MGVSVGGATVGGSVGAWVGASVGAGVVAGAQAASAMAETVITARNRYIDFFMISPCEWIGVGKNSLSEKHDTSL